MELIVQDLLGINKVQFPFNGFLSLTEYIHELTLFYKVPFSADHTEYEKPTATYTCTFGGRCRANYSKTNTGCESILVFAKDFIDENTVLFTFDISRSVLRHNHTLNPHFIEAHRNCLSAEHLMKLYIRQR